MNVLRESGRERERVGEGEGEGEGEEISGTLRIFSPISLIQ
jgi:hypothetical protein